MTDWIELHQLQIPVGSYVRWVGPPEMADKFELTNGHPGRLTIANRTHAVIDWVDKSHYLQYNGAFDSGWIDEISERDFFISSENLRSSDWPGFPVNDRKFASLFYSDPWISVSSAFEPGMAVAYIGPTEIGATLGIAVGDLGRVTSSGPKHVFVDWKGDGNPKGGDDALDPAWLEVVSDETYLGCQ